MVGAVLTGVVPGTGIRRLLPLLREEVWVMSVNFFNRRIEDSTDWLCAPDTLQFEGFPRAIVPPGAFLLGVPVVSSLCPAIARTGNLINSDS